MLPTDLDDAIGMLYSVMAQVQGMDFILAPVVRKLEQHRNNYNKNAVEHGSIDGTATRISTDS